jgi:hypothetical protein
MTRSSPPDATVNKVVRELIDTGLRADEKLAFITTNNQVAAVLYASEFDNSTPSQIRAQLEKEGRLKGIVYVSALHIGQRPHAPRASVVEYLPDRQRYHYRFAPSHGIWVPAEYEDADQSYEEFWREEST